MPRRDIHRRTILLFVLGIALPSSLFAYLAFRGIRNDQALLERERREDLREILSEVTSAYDSGLHALGAALDSVLTAVDSSDRAVAVRDFADREPTVDIAFHLSADDAIDMLLGSAVLYRHVARPDPLRGLSSTTRELDGARRLEHVDRNPEAALQTYRRLSAAGSPPDVGAEALSNAARLERRRGKWQRAAADYRRLAAEFGDVATLGGIPFAFAARLELGVTLLEAGDGEAAGRVLLGLYGELTKGGQPLTRAQYLFLSAQVRERLDAAAAAVAATDAHAAFLDSLQALTAFEDSVRPRTERIVTFTRSAGEVFGARRAQFAGARGSYGRIALDIEGRPYYALLRSPPMDTAAGRPGAWGLLLDADAVTARLEASLAERLEPNQVGWSLVGPAGSVIRASGIRPDEVVPVSAGLPGGVPPLTINLYPADAGFVRTLLTSRRGIFFYAFLLLAGILIVGLVLTTNTVTHQLELARMQSDFVSTVSHEFRSPLTAIRQIGEMLQSNKVPSEEKRRAYYDMLVEQSERLSVLLNRVLDFSRMESGEHALHLMPVAVKPVLDDAIAQAEQRVDHDGFNIRHAIADDLPIVALDEDAFRQVVSNLIDNGIKFSGESQEIVVHGFVDNGHLVVAVQDFGIGMSPEERTHAFERFYRGEEALTRAVRGTGLGLAIVKHIVEGHGGRVDVESSPGQGSTFSVRLPLPLEDPDV